MARTQYSFAKRQREIEKRKKAEEKRARRQTKAQEDGSETDSADVEQTPPTSGAD
ncbi:MAG: hypothetical protein R3E86_10545 [Pseudomonadales bacterium]